VAEQPAHGASAPMEQKLDATGPGISFVAARCFGLRPDAVRPVATIVMPLRSLGRAARLFAENVTEIVAQLPTWHRGGMQ
jgi:hypothetical protein